MAWPPATLPTNRSNATPQQDTHPTDHNTTNAAVNDTVGQLTTISSSVNTLSTQVGCSYAQAGQTYTPGQQTSLLWPTRNYDTHNLNVPNGATFTVPTGFSGSWSFICWVLSNPGAPVNTCTLYIDTSPALSVQIADYIIANTRHARVHFVGRLTPGITVSFGFYNAHSGNVSLAAQMEARWLGM